MKLCVDEYHGEQKKMIDPPKIWWRVFRKICIIVALSVYEGDVVGISVQRIVRHQCHVIHEEGLGLAWFLLWLLASCSHSSYSGTVGMPCYVF